MVKLKEVLFAIFCVGILYSATADYGTFKLYNLYGGEHAYVQTDATITNDVGFTSTPKILGTNKYCPGNFKINADIEGTWLINSNNFEAKSDYPVGTDSSCTPLTSNSNKEKCPLMPISYTTINPDKNFEWLTISGYSAVFPNNAYVTTQPSQLSVFHNEKIAKYMYGGADDYQEFTNRKGGVNLFCKGSVLLKVDNNLMVTNEVVNAADYTKNIGVGSHSVKSELSAVECFAAIKKYPDNDNFFRIYFMKKWTPSLTGTSDTLSFTVDDPQLDFDSTKTYPLDSQLQMEPNQDKDVFFNIENNGDVKFKVTDVSAGAGTTNGFTVNEAPNTVFYPLQAANIQNGFNKEIATGQSKIIAVRIHSPNTIPANSKIKIKFQITATEKTCAEDGVDGAEVNADGYEFKWFDFKFPIIPLPVLKSCEFVPTTQTVEIDDVANYTLYCYDKSIASPTKTKVNCLDNGMEITTNPQSVAVLAQSPTQSSGPKTNVKIKAIAKGSSTITADNNLPNPVICSATIQSNEQALPIPDACTLQKSNTFSSNAIGLYSVFVMTCYKNGQQIDCPKNTSTLNIGATNGIVSYYAYSALNTEESLLSFKNLKYGSGMVSVSENTGKYSCSAAISLAPSSLSYCALTPASVQTEVGKIEQFNITCNEVGVNVPCKSVAWSTSGVSANLGTKDNTKAQVTFNTEGTGFVTATVAGTNGLPLNYTCSANAQVSEPYVVPTPDACTLLKNTLVSNDAIGQYTFYSMKCYKNGQQINCPETDAPLNIGATNGIASYFGYSSTELSTLVGFKNLKYGSGMISVSENTGKYSCSAAISLAPSSLSYCALTPASVQTEVGKSEQFNITCNEVGVNVPCKSVAWSTSGVTSSFGIKTNTKAQLTFTSTGTGLVTANVAGTNGLPLNYTCSANVQVLNGMITTCEITPEKYAGYTGTAVKFLLKCYEGYGVMDRKEIPCEDMEWFAFNKDIETPILFQNQSEARIKFTDIGAISILARSRIVMCRANALISAPPTQKDLGDKCEIIVLEEITYGDSFTADITCMNSTSGKKFPCENVTWGLEGDHGTIDGDNAVATCTLTGEDTIVATIDGEVHYVCKLSLSETVGKKCVISPIYWIAKPAEKKDFTVKCDKKDCDNIKWGNSYPEYMTLTNPDPGNKSIATVEIGKDVKNKVEDAVVYVDASYLDEKYYCEADIYIGALMCVDYI